METRGSQTKGTSQIEDGLSLESKSSVLSINKNSEFSREHSSYLRLLITLVSSIFLAEVVVMILIYELPPLPYQYVTLIDAATMTIFIFPILYFLSFQPLVRHIEKRQQAEEHLRRVNRALTVLNECNQVLVRAEKENKLLQQMCEIIVNTGGYCMAWVGFAEQDATRSVRPAAQFGFEDGYLDLAQITWADNERGRGPTGTAIRQGVVQVNQNFLTNPNMEPWRESALLRGYQSSIALPLQDESSTLGALTIYSALPDAFDEEEIHLLKELADDLAFGITALRVRAERNRAQEQVREMALFPILNPDAVLRVDSAGQIDIANGAAEQIGLCIGVQLTDVIPSFRDLDIASCIANGTTQQLQETCVGERVLQWTIHGAPALGLAFLYSTDITLRKQAEDLNRQLSSIVKQTEDTVVVTNREGVIEYVNPAFERSTGYTREEVLGKTSRVLKSGLHDDHFYQELWKTILRGDVFLGEIANRKKNGELFYEVKTITPLRDMQGNITHFVATGKDITEHKLDEEKLLKAYDDLELHVQERTEELRIANSELHEEILARRQAEQALRAARDELEVHVQERTEELAVANRDLLKEINERKEIERQLRLQTTAMEAAANGIIITDRQGNIQWTNPALTQISGYDTDELIGHSTKIFNSGQHNSAYYRQMWDTILSGEVWWGEMINRRKDGSFYVEEQTITPVRSDSSEITQFIAIKQDITERKQAEKDIEERSQKEKILTQTIHTMQLDIARDLHDTIGQNISFLRMKLDYLAEKKIRKKAELQVELRTMARAANESYDLMRGTLAVLQSENSTDLFRLFTRYAEQIEERSSFKTDFSSQGEPRFMSAKRMRQLFYIFREILNNIEKHANAGQVCMEMNWDRNTLNLVVSDNGSGFDLDKVQYGSHYGLKFMKERAELLNGSLLIRSAIGAGTKIMLQVPYE